MKIKGSSLIEVIIAAGVMAGISLVVSRLGIMGVESAKNVENRFDLSSTQNEIQGVLMTPQVCLENFQGLKPEDANALTSIKVNGNDKYILDASGDSSKVRIKSITFGGVYNAFPGTPNTGETILTVEYASKKGLESELSLGRRVMSIVVNKDGAGKVSNCNTFSTTYQGLWSIDQATKNIYYNTAKVGIGTSAPAQPLDVAGNINTSGSLTSSGDITATGKVLANQMGVNNPTPSAQFHVKGDAQVAIVEGSSHEYLSFYRNGVRDGWIGYGGAGTNIMSINNERNGQINLGNPSQPIVNYGQIQARNGIDVISGVLTLRNCVTKQIIQSLGAGWSLQTFVLPGAGSDGGYYQYCGANRRPVTTYCSIGIPNDYGWPGDFHKINTYKNGIDANGWAWCGVYNQSGGTTVTKQHTVRCCQVNYW